MVRLRFIGKSHRQILASLMIFKTGFQRWIPCEQACILNNKISGSKLVTVPDTGHLVIEENPAALVKEIRHFFASDEV